MAVKDIVLETLQEGRGTYVSGEELSDSLNVSRAAVWKAIKSLRDDGYNIEAVTNKGYRMPPADETITEDSLRYALPPHLRTGKCFIYDTIDSTNLQAKKLLLDGKAGGGCAVIANHQTAGRGRLGRSFFSPENGLYLSVIIDPDFDMSKSVMVTVAAAAAVATSIEDVCGQNARIKWVNDIYVDDRKVCGILTEAMTDFESGQINNLVIGIGINTDLKGFPEELLQTAGAVTLRNPADKSKLAAEVIRRTLEYTAQIQDPEPEFLEIYRAKSLVVGQNILVFKGKYRNDPTSELGGIPAKALGISDNGGLEVIYTDGKREILTSGEVTIRRIK